MKFRVFSDLHIDVNKQFNFNIPKIPKDNILNIIPGDISGNFELTIKWLQENINKCLFISGNHELAGYDSIGTLQYFDNCFKSILIKDKLYLQNSFIEIEDTIFIGSTLFTDYKYDDYYDISNMERAKIFINDFRCGLYDICDDSVQLQPWHYKDLNEISFNYIKTIVEKYKNKKIVIITHHGCSSKDIIEKYKNHILNASFISEYDNFILKHKNIKYWIHGHLHNSSDYVIGKTRIICNPLGYNNENPNFNNNLILEV